MDKRFVALFALILISGTIARLVTLRFGTFMEPDSYAYYSVAQQTIANNLTITSQLSGFPTHNPYNEMPGLIYMAIFFSYITGSIMSSMMLLPAVFAFFEMLAVYALTLKLSGRKYAGLLAMLLYAMLPGAIIKNVAGEWRGDSFVPLFVAAALLMIIYAYERRDWRLYALSPVPIMMSIWTWKGGVYAVAVVALLALLFLLYRLRRSLVLVAGAGAVLTIAGALAFAHLENSGIYTVTTALNTIAELQPPTAFFLVMQMGLAVGFAPVGVLLYALKDRYPGSDKAKKHRRARNIAFIALLSLFAVTAALQLTAVRYVALVAMPMAVFTGYVLAEFYAARRSDRSWMSLAVVLTVAVALGLSVTVVPSWTPADNISPAFMNALSWLHTHTAANTTFLTDWPDGSLVEGVAQRQSYSDSIFGSTNGWQDFPRFLFARAGNFTYLDRVRPDCILVRRYWLQEAGAIAEEGGLPAGMPLNGTNFMALENGSEALPIVYRNNDTLVYRYGGTCGP
ncbi:MAG: hypothetical protein M1321_02780 [Candidatus Marsarchaeota archaeon]|nr:hypothetical protein [Candidatus Marsarchaeota archaeon]